MIDIGRDTKLVRRSEWGARPPRSASSFTPSFGSTCHWEGPRMGSFPHASCATKVRVIQDFHMDSRGWQDIAYTAVVCPHGYVFEGRWTGRRTAANGTNDGNSRAYAICYLGGQTDPWTPDGQRAMRAALDWLDAHGGAGPGRNGHRDWKPTECPGNAIYGWVHRGQPAGGTPASQPQEDDMTPNELDNMLADVLAGRVEGGNARAELAKIFKGQRAEIKKDAQAAVDEVLGLHAITEDSALRRALRAELDARLG